MPPSRTIHVNRLTILRSIASIAAAQRTAALERTTYFREKERREVLAMAQWAPRDLSRLAGKVLTPSERKRHQEALRQMEFDGLVRLDCRHVRLTSLGNATLKAEARATSRDLNIPP